MGDLKKLKKWVNKIVKRQNAIEKLQQFDQKHRAYLKQEYIYTPQGIEDMAKAVGAELFEEKLLSNFSKQWRYTFTYKNRTFCELTDKRLAL